jgi:hypothetical protein
MQQFALAKLIPHLGAHAHAAAGALLVINAGDSRAARAGEPVIAEENVWLDKRAKGFTLQVEDGQFGCEFLLTKGGAHANFLKRRSEFFNVYAGRGEGSFQGFSALQADELLTFEAISF